MKFFKNSNEDIVKEALTGLIASNDQIALLDSFPKIKVALRKDWDKSKVAIISGGGSGHEPAHAGFVGKGMLTAAVCGEIFASPSVDAVLAAIIAVTGEKGCLLVIKNYTGDRLNFGLAAEQARNLGYKVETVVVNDDIALGISSNSRGIAGTIFIHKIAGQLAEDGKSLPYIFKTAKQTIENIYSLGLSLTECQRFEENIEHRIKDKEVELGLGIHGEAGAKIIPLNSADVLTTTVANELLPFADKHKGKIAIMINNLGTAMPLEMNIVVNALLSTKLGKKINYIIGPAQIMTALNMDGFSFSIILLDNVTEKALLKENSITSWPGTHIFNPKKAFVKMPKLPPTIKGKPSNHPAVKKIIEDTAKLLISIEKEMNDLDAKVGDGDAGSTFAAASKNILNELNKLPLNNGSDLLNSIGSLLSREAGGSSGVLMSILFIAAGDAFTQYKHWGKALLKGLETMQTYGGAKIGSRTMVDALEPALLALAADKSLAEVAKAARKGAENTKKIKKTDFGRSSYIPATILKNVPDPGAEIMARIFENLIEA
ncbi:dihydroxyacetone kinase subunit DhaK [Rhizosphaericola mali]|uniref:DAK2 domain-containing protein n=1 Tax=Rhizosphaericola mali TaxID=2545455 RepID=A0A5P2G5Q9_9BACT|nr:dihydroxyacetone kinase subunit DhaK [Rhizosphaericola mali]QES89100.1 DAK2 domain-containing protein [Rhizosphaericola mali]